MSANDLAERLDAVERALTDDDTDLTELRDAAALSEDVERLERRVADLEATVEELDAAVEAVRGYAGNVRAVNRDVERRASAALAKAEALEAAVDTTTDEDVIPPRGRPERDGYDDRSSRRRNGREITNDGTNGQGDDVGRIGGRPSTERPRGRRTRAYDGTTNGSTSGSTNGSTPTRNGTDEEASGTEQFIERVRDAL